MEPASWDGRALLERLDVELVRSDQFLCHPEEFAAWAGDRAVKMEDFYRWQRRRLGHLMDGDQPAGGRWNFDHDNRERPPTDGRAWPEVLRTPLDDLDRAVLADLPDTCWGAPPDGTWATTRAEALRRLDHAVDVVLPRFGPHEDAMLSTSWSMAHTLLSPYLNLGLLHPGEVADAAEVAYREGRVPIASAEGFVRQVIGWREYVWGRYWQWMPGYRDENALGADRPLPPVYTGAPTDMACVASALASVHDHGWAHHIQRLMVLGNLALLAGVDPWALTEWMWAGFVDGAEWVMLPNVIGMSQHADGGRMATKPYAAGRRLHRPHERPLPGLPLRPQGPGGRGRLPVHHPLLGLPGPAPRPLPAATPGWPARSGPPTAWATSTPSAAAPWRSSTAWTPAPSDPRSVLARESGRSRDQDPG